MGTYRVKLQAKIDDEIEVEADSEEEALNNAARDWMFVEASEWESEIIDRPDEEDEDDADD
jgi:predicted glycosyl hydrolase (DUF1957 family)